MATLPFLCPSCGDQVALETRAAEGVAHTTVDVDGSPWVVVTDAEGVELHRCHVPG